MCASAILSEVTVLLVITSAGRTTPEMWKAMWTTIGRTDVLDDPRFDRKERAKNMDELIAILEGWTGQRSKHEVMKLMGEAGVPCGAVLDSVELLNDPHMRERGMVVTVDHPARGKFTMPGCPTMRRSCSRPQTR